MVRGFAVRVVTEPRVGDGISCDHRDVKGGQPEIISQERLGPGRQVRIPVERAVQFRAVWSQQEHRGPDDDGHQRACLCASSSRTSASLKDHQPAGLWAAVPGNGGDRSWKTLRDGLNVASGGLACPRSGSPLFFSGPVPIV